MHGVFAGWVCVEETWSDDATSWQARHRVHAPRLLIYWATSAALLAPKATAGFMNGVRPERRQCVQRYNFFVGSMTAVVFALWSSRRLVSASTSSRLSSPRNFCRRTCGSVGGPLVNNSRGKARNSHTVIGFLARESMTYPETWVSSVGCSASSLVTKSTKAADTDCP